MLSALLGDNLAGANGCTDLDAQSPHDRAYSPFPSPSGELIQDPDFALPTSAGALPWRLFYYSNSSQVNGDFGYGRRASWPLRACAETAGGITTVTLQREDGTTVRYQGSGSTYTPLTQRIFDTLAPDPAGGWNETRLDTGAVFHYPAGSFASLSYYKTVTGQIVTMNYDASGRLQ